MNKSVYDYYVTKQHHKLRREFDEISPEKYAQSGLSLIERTTDRFEKLCKAQTPVIMDGEKICFVRTATCDRNILTESERSELISKHSHFLEGRHEGFASLFAFKAFQRAVVSPLPGKGKCVSGCEF